MHRHPATESFAAGPSPRPVPTSLLDPSLRASTVGAVALVSVLAFEAMAVATAMPAIAAALDGLSLYGLAFGASLAVSVVGMVAAGILSDRRGPHIPFAIGVGLFVAGLLLAGAAPSMVVLVVARACKGLGIGMAIVTLYLVVDVYPDDLQPRMFAAFSAAWVVPALVGPAIAGTLVEYVHWRAVFLSVLVIAVPGALLVWRAMPRTPRRDDGPRWSAADRRRTSMAVIAAIGVGAIHLTAQTGAVLARAALGAAVVVTLLAARSLLPAGTLRLARGLPAVIALRGMAGAAFFGAEVLVPLLLIEQRGLSTTSAGLVLTGGAIGWSAGSWAQGRWPARDARWGRRGMLSLTAGILMITAVVSPTIPVTTAYVGWALAGIGMGMLYPVLSVRVLQLSPEAEQGQNVSSLQVSDAVASSTALAASGTLLALAGATPTVFVIGLLFTAALALATALATPRAQPVRR